MSAMQRANRGSSGFTLIELMIALAIVGVLVAMATAGFQLYQLRSKRSEALMNLAALRTAQLAYFNERGGFVPAAQSPALPGYPGPDKANWIAAGGRFSSDLPGWGFDILGWQPEGPTYFDYDTVAQQGANGWMFTAAAYGDTDGDGFISVFLYVSPDSVGATLQSGWGGFVAPFNPHTCAPQWNTVAQVPPHGACGFPNADDF